MRLGLGLGVNKGRRKMGSIAEGVIAALESQASTDGFTAFSGATKDASLVMVESLVAAGVWSKLDLFYVFATNGDSDFATYNWIDPTSFKLTKFNNPTFTSLEGFTGNGSTMWMNANFDASSGAGTNYLQDSASFGFYSRSANAIDLNLIGDTEMILGVNANYYYRINALNPNITGTTGNNQGMLHANRDSSNSDAVFRNGVSVVTSSTASTTIPNQLYILRRSGGGFSSRQISMFFLGGSLSSEASDFYNAVQTYMTTLGKQV